MFKSDEPVSRPYTEAERDYVNKIKCDMLPMLENWNELSALGDNDRLTITSGTINERDLI